MADWEAPGTFDPRPPTTAARLRDDSLVYGRLWTSDPAGRLIPDLAVAVPTRSGGVLSVRLRSGLRWSDGSPLTPADAAASLREQGLAAEAVDSRTLRVTADSRAVAAAFIAPAQPDGRVASGPFRLASADATALRFERNPHYHGHPPYLATVVELISASHDAMIESAQAGEVDYLPHLGPADLATSFGPLRLDVTRSEREEVLVPQGLGISTAAALSAATDRQALADQQFGGRAAATGPPPQALLASFLLPAGGVQVSLQTVCDDPLRLAEAGQLATEWQPLGVRATVTCAPIARLTAAPTAPRVALYSVLAGQAPPGAIPLLRWPGVRAISPALHGFTANDTVGTDLWDVADWWLQ